MKDLKEFEIKLKSYNKLVLSPRELKEVGINTYYMKKLVEKGVLNKIGRGDYQVELSTPVIKQEENKTVTSFALFRKNILEHNYKEAYQILIEIYGQQTNHNYDDHMYLYFSLLKEILGSSYDFSILDKLLTFSYDQNSNSYFAYYISFRENVMKKDYTTALADLRTFKTEELKNKRVNNMSTLLFEALLEEVCKIKNVQEPKEIKVKEGTINKDNNIQKSIEEYDQFILCIEEGDFANALLHLEECRKYNDSSNKELLTILLEGYRALANDEIDFYEEKAINYYGNFCQMLKAAICRKDFIRAYKIVNQFPMHNKELEYMKKILNEMYTIAKAKKTQQSTIQPKKVEMPASKEIVLDELDRKRYTYAYKQFKECLEQKDYENALNYLKKSIEFSKYDENQNKKLLEILLEGLLALQKNEIDFDEEKGISYEGNDYQILTEAIQNKDFKTAFKNIGKCTYKNTDEELNMMKKILHKMFELNKDKVQLNPKAIKNTKIEEDTVQETITIDGLYSLIYESKYSESLEILSDMKQKNDKIDRVYAIALKLIKQLEEAKQGKNVAGGGVHYYENIDPFKKTYEALRIKDYRTAKEIISEAIELAYNKTEFQIYAMILDDIVHYMDLNEIDKQINEIIHKNMFSLEAIQNIESLIIEREKIQKEENKNSDALNIIEVIYDAMEGKIAETDFENFTDDKQSPLDNLNSALQNGDYINASNILITTKENLLSKEYTPNDLKILKFLLNALRYHIKKKDKSYVLNKELLDVGVPVEYSEFRPLVKKRQYKEALAYYKKHNIPLSASDTADVAANLIYLLYEQDKMNGEDENDELSRN